MKSTRTKVPFKSWFWAQVILPVLLSLSLSHTHTHTLTHTHTHTHTHSLSLSLLYRTNFPHWAEKIAVSQSPHPSCSTLRMIKKRGCAGLHIHQLKQGSATLGESDFRTTGGVSQWHVYFLVVWASDCPLQPYLHQEAVVAHSCWVLIHDQPLFFVSVLRSLLESCEQLYNIVLLLSSSISRESKAQAV